MSHAYVDTSCLVAIALHEPGHESVEVRLNEYDGWVASALTLAELRSVLTKAGRKDDDGSKLLLHFDWILPQTALKVQVARVLEVDVPLKGADIFHLACALYAETRYKEPLAFYTLDGPQSLAALKLGFQI